VDTPEVIQRPAAAYDAVMAEIVLFGGTGSVLGNDNARIWRHRFSSAAHPADSCLDTDTDGDGLVGCADPDCWGRCQPFCPPRTTCDTSTPHCGDGTCSALEDYRLCPADCSK
jgi:hypothetical protein